MEIILYLYDSFLDLVVVDNGAVLLPSLVVTSAEMAEKNTFKIFFSFLFLLLSLLVIVECYMALSISSYIMEFILSYLELL